MPNLDENNQLNSELSTRLETAFHSFQSTRDDVFALKSAYNVLQRDIAGLTVSIDKLVSRFEDSKKTNWPLLAMLSGLLPLVIAGMGFFITSYTSGAMSPVLAQISQVQANVRALEGKINEIATTQNNRGKEISLIAQQTTANTEIIRRLSDNQGKLQESVAASAGADVASRTDRIQLNDRMKKAEDQIGHETSDRRAQAAEFRVHLGEIEQQFHSVSNLENLRAAQQERINSMLWEKSHPGERYPNSTFFPTTIFQGAGGGPPMGPTLNGGDGYKP